MQFNQKLFAILLILGCIVSQKVSYTYVYPMFFCLFATRCQQHRRSYLLCESDMNLLRYRCMKREGWLRLRVLVVKCFNMVGGVEIYS